MRRRRTAILVLVIVGGMAVAAGGVVVLRRALNPFDNRAFSAAAWAAGSPEVRAAMAGDAVRHVRPGMSEAEVVALLGKPDPDNVLQGGRDARVRGARAYTYYIGSWSMGGMDDAFVYVHLDASGRVVASEIHGY